MTTFVLLRHASHDWLGRGLAGRLPGVSLNAKGRAEAQQMVGRFAGVPLAAVYSSPQPRTQQTAQPLAASLGLPVAIEPGVDEIDFGTWMGRHFEDLRGTEGWEHWVHRRGSACPPGGEPFEGVPVRAMAALQRLRAAHPDGQVLVVSHGDVIKAILATCLGMSLDHLERLEIAPASASVVAMGEDWRQVKLVNGLGAFSA
ncbi:MAG TPA: histidine phosphatase family protein [Ramlibacter sp.]